MEKYQAPIQDINFVLSQLIDFEKYLDSVNNKELSFADIKMIIEEAGKFATQELDSINQKGDQEGIKLENGVVRMPTHFIKAYQNFVENGWFSVIGEKKYGGQNLPLSAVVSINEIWQSTNLSFASNNMLTQGAIELLESHGNDTQKNKFLPNLILANGGYDELTEPQAGSDLSLIKTKAIKQNSEYLIKEQKFILLIGIKI